MRYATLSALLVFASAVWSQDGRTNPQDLNGSAAAAPQFVQGFNQTAPKNKIPNPFDARPSAAVFGMDMEGMMGMDDGMESAGGLMGGMGGMAGGDMEDMMEMGMGGGPSPDELFRRGLQRAIQSLKKAKTDEEKEVLRGYVRLAFADRYDKLIASRKKDLERLKQSVARLDSDLKRREAAKDRVVQLQLQSVQLAAEGLLELGELQGVSVGGSAGPGGLGAGGFGYGGGADDGEMDAVNRRGRR